MILVQKDLLSHVHPRVIVQERNSTARGLGLAPVMIIVVGTYVEPLSHQSNVYLEQIVNGSGAVKKMLGWLNR